MIFFALPFSYRRMYAVSQAMSFTVPSTSFPLTFPFCASIYTKWARCTGQKITLFSPLCFRRPVQYLPDTLSLHDAPFILTKAHVFLFLDVERYRPALHWSRFQLLATSLPSYVSILMEQVHTLLVYSRMKRRCYSLTEFKSLCFVAGSATNSQSAH